MRRGCIRTSLVALAPLPAAEGWSGRLAPALRRRNHHIIRATVIDPESQLGQLYGKSREVRCPFWRTRAYDTLEAIIAVANFVAARHKSILDRPWLPGSDASLFEPLAMPVPVMGTKTRGLPLAAVMDVVRRDFEQGQYYVSGRLSQAIYHDSAFFDSPDPDMPVRSLQRYSDALKGLFDPALSSIELVSMHACDEHERSFIAHWRLTGHLKLPWRPAIKPYAGATRYELDDDMLIVAHTESWSISVFDAFASTVWPSFGAPAAPSVAEHVFVEPPPPVEHADRFADVGRAL